MQFPAVRGVGQRMNVSLEGQRRPPKEPWALVFSEWRAISEPLHISLESIPGGRARGRWDQMGGSEGVSGGVQRQTGDERAGAI